MMEHGQPGPDVDQFLRDKIDTVPHLEALLLLWNGRPKPYSVEMMAERLFLAPEAAKNIGRPGPAWSHRGRPGTGEVIITSLSWIGIG